MVSSSRPENEPEIDREIRIEKIKRELDDLSGGSMISGGLGEVPLELEEAFLAHVCELEKAPRETNFNRLLQRGIELIPPPELDDTSLHEKLYEVLQALAGMRCFLYQTDHLSERELYSSLWEDLLREETPDLSQTEGAWHTSPIGAGGDEDNEIYLKYYASDEERRRWHEQFPTDPIPQHCPLSYDRDRNLPRSE